MESCIESHIWKLDFQRNDRPTGVYPFHKRFKTSSPIILYPVFMSHRATSKLEGTTVWQLLKLTIKAPNQEQALSWGQGLGPPSEQNKQSHVKVSTHLCLPAN